MPPYLLHLYSWTQESNFEQPKFIQLSLPAIASTCDPGEKIVAQKRQQWLIEQAQIGLSWLFKHACILILPGPSALFLKHG